MIFAHSAVPALNQLLLPFLSLVAIGELLRNPTAKKEISVAGRSTVNALMFTYPVHQAADVLSSRPSSARPAPILSARSPSSPSGGPT